MKEQAEEEREKVSLTLPPELNDWLDDLVKKGRRNHGQKIPKQIWVQAAIELLQSLPVDWYEIDSVETFRQELQKIESRKWIYRSWFNLTGATAKVKLEIKSYSLEELGCKISICCYSCFGRPPSSSGSVINGHCYYLLYFFTNSF